MSEELEPAGEFFESRLGQDVEVSPVVTTPPVSPNTGGTLQVLVPGGFHSERFQTAPDGIYIIWSFQGAPPDVVGDLGIRIMTQPLYLVRCIMKTPAFEDLKAASARMDAVLHRAPPQSLPGGYLMRSCVRERPYALVETLIDIERRQLGGYYRLTIIDPNQ
jgi:hypothetical protein